MMNAKEEPLIFIELDGVGGGGEGLIPDVTFD